MRLTAIRTYYWNASFVFLNLPYLQLPNLNGDHSAALWFLPNTYMRLQPYAAKGRSSPQSTVWGEGNHLEPLSDPW